MFCCNGRYTISYAKPQCNVMNLFIILHDKAKQHTIIYITFYMVKIGSISTTHRFIPGSQAQTLDFRAAASQPEFSLHDPVLDAAKRAGTDDRKQLKTVFAAESGLNVARRIRNACVPLGQKVEDDAQVAEDVFFWCCVWFLEGEKMRFFCGIFQGVDTG